MPSSHNHTPPSPTDHVSFPSPPDNPSSGSSTTTEISPPSVSSKRTTPLSSSPGTEDIEDRLRIDSAGSTTRSPSPSRVDALSRFVAADSPRCDRSLSRGSGSRTPDTGDSWWGGREFPARPWIEPPKSKETLPPVQSERWVVTRQRVASAAASVLGTTGDVAHELLQIGVGSLGFAPIPGLEPAACAILEIWDTLQQVDMDRFACLRLTERCADILLSIREEIHEAGNHVGIELQAQITKLVEEFARVHAPLRKHANRPFIQRYLKRDDTLQAIQGCAAELISTLDMFSLPIQIRMLRQIQDSGRQRKAAMEALVAAMKGGVQPRAIDIKPAMSATTTFVSPQPTDRKPTFRDHMTSLNPDEVGALLQSCRERQDGQDSVHDMEDLRQLMTAVLQSGGNVTIMDILQVGRHEIPEAVKAFQRALEREVTWGQDAGSPHGEVFYMDSVGARGSRDGLDLEFLESGIEALRRMSKGTELSLPPWTITKWEVDHEGRIRIGFFSDVYKGSWKGMAVAIKMLTPTTPRKLFVHEVEIWKTLLHPNVLKFLGASSTSGESRCFFVSLYMKHGSLVKYLKNVEHHSQANPLRMIYEVVLGMAYLHERGVLHGDLKAANVLVDDEVRCVISDFGQHKMKSEVWRISEKSPPHRALRWQAPELMADSDGEFLAPMDVYAFGICCVEILTKGSLPWPLLDDKAVRYLVLQGNRRPDIPNSHPWTKELAKIIAMCWRQQPSSRPNFSEVVAGLGVTGKKYDVSLQHTPPPDLEIVGELSMGDGSSLLGLSTDREEYADIRMDSPPPLDEVVESIKDERRYRMLLDHEFHPSLNLPLWSPSAVKIGSVGYLRKPEGEFVTLFNAFDPLQTSGGVLKGMVNLYGYGRVSKWSRRQDKRNRVQRGLDALQCWIPSELDPNNINRRYSFGIKANRKLALLCAESTMYDYIEDLSAPKRWFKANVDEILRLYAEDHSIIKEDLFLAIGTLSAPDYALFVSRKHPNGQVHFKVFASPRNGQPWGKFTTSTDISPSILDGFNDPEESATPFRYETKVSETSDSEWHSLLLARLRFKPDVPDPTSL